MAKPSKRKAAAASLSATLRALPIDRRAEMIVDLFRIISSEFAKMVLEHVKPERKPKRRRKPPS